MKCETIITRCLFFPVSLCYVSSFLFCFGFLKSYIGSCILFGFSSLIFGQVMVFFSIMFLFQLSLFIVPNILAFSFFTSPQLFGVMSSTTHPVVRVGVGVGVRVCVDSCVKVCWFLICLNFISRSIQPLASPNLVCVSLVTLRVLLASLEQDVNVMVDPFSLEIVF